MVRCSCGPSSVHKAVHRFEVNCGPLSDVMSAGTPNRAMWCEMRARAHEAAVASVIGMASGHRVYRLMIVNRYVIPREGGRGYRSCVVLLLRRL